MDTTTGHLPGATLCPVPPNESGGWCSELETIFNNYDKDKNGTLDASEVRLHVHPLCRVVAEQNVARYD